MVVYPPDWKTYYISKVKGGSSTGGQRRRRLGGHAILMRGLDELNRPAEVLNPLGRNCSERNGSVSSYLNHRI
jgi:hypothetical protein